MHLKVYVGDFLWYIYSAFPFDSQELATIEQKLTMPKTVIAVVGGTGEGKSSLMNALLDHQSVLPTSGVRACTAVVVEVVQNTNKDVYEADIEFLQRQVFVVYNLSITCQ